nr:uncharacterized protein LOC112010928 [Quercus suber]
MTLTKRYSSGLELANFVVTLDILHDAWTAIWILYTEISQNEGPSSFVRFKVYELPNYTIIAFFTWPSSSKDSVQGGGGGNLVSSSTFKLSFPFFDFLCPRPKDPSFSINETAFQLFKSIFGVLPKFEIDNSKQLIITGNSLGGSVATLFTLSLLKKFNFSKSKGPLCITFGSPLIGDENLQEAISKYAAWNSRFLHVVSDQDLVPRVLINGYQPFGTFLFCSKLGCSCFEDHQTILELLTATNSGTPENEDPNKVFESYGTFVKDLNRKVICKDTTYHESLIDWTTTPLRAGIITQLAAIGLVQSQVSQLQLFLDQEKANSRLEKREVDPQKGTKQQKVAKDPRDKRSTSVDSLEEQTRADVRLSQRTWSPQLEVDGATIPWNASVRNFQKGCTGYIAEALEQHVLLSRDMEAYRHFKQNDLFLSLKRDLAMWVRDTRNEANVEALSCADVEESLRALKQEQVELSKKLKEMNKAHLSAKAGLKTVERHVEDQQQKLHLTEIDPATQRQLVMDLKAELQKAKEAAQLVKKAAEAEKQASYLLGKEETQVRLNEELAEVCRDYCTATWDKALSVVIVPIDFV